MFSQESRFRRKFLFFVCLLRNEILRKNEDQVNFVGVYFIKLNEKFDREKRFPNVDPKIIFGCVRIKFCLQNSPLPHPENNLRQNLRFEKIYK